MLSRKLFSFVATLLLLCLLAWQSAQLIWQVLSPRLVLSDTSSSKPSTGFAMSAIQLFGNVNSNATSNVQVGAPDAQVLQGWLLLGTLLDGEHALALVQMGTGGVHWLKVGQRLDNGLQVVSVSSNDVQLLTAQGIKTISLLSKPMAITSPVITAAPPTLNTNLQTVRQQLKQNPMSAMKLMRMDPVWNNGQLSGLKLMPQAEQEVLFNQLGLKAGDVLVGLNGEPVGSWMSKMAELPKILDTNGARVKVLRGGAETEWMVNW